MKILLIQPPFEGVRTVGPPIGLGNLASCLETRGHKIKIIDSVILGYKLEDIHREIKKTDPDVVGVTSTTRHIYDAISIVKLAKEYNPNCLTVLGGPHPTVMAKELLEENNHVDVVVRGEGEITFTELLSKNRQGWKEVKGITFRSNGKIIHNDDRPFIEDLDSLPFPAYHLLPMNKYKVMMELSDIDAFGKPRQQYGAISTCRGCPYDCVFCSSKTLWGRRWRARSPENIVEELRLLREKYNMRIIDFMDDTFTIKKERTKAICRKIKEEKLDISWICSSRVDLFNREIANVLKQAGCKIVFFGLESGVQKTLDFLCKGFTIEQSKKAVQIAKDIGLGVTSGFIIGVPGETKEMINKTITYAKNLNLTTAAFSVLTPFPGTQIYKYAVENDLLITKDWSRYTPSNPVMKIFGLTPKQVKWYFVKANVICNLRPIHIFKSILSR